MKKVAIVQSNYIAWKGYFDMIRMVDEFILYDDVQYTRRDWRNRNKIKTPNGLLWLTIPVDVKGKYHQKINETLISDPKWAKDHWATITQFYSKTKFFKDYKAVFEDFYMNVTETHLSQVNHQLMTIINNILGITTKLSWSGDYTLVDGQTERLLSLVQQANGNEYISGPLAKDYLDESMFNDVSIKVSWMEYSGYPEYTQLYPPFEHGVSVLDLIFNEGPEAINFIIRDKKAE